MFVADARNYRVRQIASVLPGGGSGNIAIAAEDGSELYVFDGTGRHLRTLDALTGAIRYAFGYDSGGHLTTITDLGGNMTTIEYQGGKPSAIVAPFGQRTTLAMDANGFLAQVTDPANESTRLASSPSGLLMTLTDPRSGIHTYTYDANGRLTRDEDPAQGVQTLARVDSATGYTVTRTTDSNHTTTYKVNATPDGGYQRVIIAPDGTQTTITIGTDGSQRTTYPDGTVETTVQGPDPRFGMQAPVTTTLTRTTPGGLTETITSQRTVTLTRPQQSLQHPDADERRLGQWPHLHKPV